jgi:hypothetical protein
MDFMKGLFGGDMGSAMMQGMRMAEMEKQMQLNQQRAQQDAVNARLLNEERALKIQEQRRQMESRDKLVKQFMPQTVTQTTTEDVGLLDAPVETTTTQESPMFTAISKMYGGDKAEMARQIMAIDPDMGVKMLGGMKPEEGYLTAGDRVFRKGPQGLTEVVGTSKAPSTRTMNIGGNEVTQQWNTQKGAWEQIASGPKWNPEKQGRETPEETGGKVRARLLAKVQTFTELMGREPTPQEKRAMMINDPYGILGGGEGETVPAAQTPKAKGKTIKRTGTDKATGRKVVQYSDGTVAYAD